jgi:hypothetical protein
VRQRHVLRWATLSAALAVAVLVTGCSLPDDNDDDQAQDRAGKQLVTRLEALPDARFKAQLTSSLEQGDNNVSVQGHAAATATDAELNSMADRVERTIWRSRLDPLGQITIDMYRSGAAKPVFRREYFDDVDRKKLLRSFGPRPDGLSG